MSDTNSLAVWPDWAIFKVFGDKFSYKSTQILGDFLAHLGKNACLN